MTSDNTNLEVIEDLKSKIQHIRNTQVMLDSDLAKLYGVPTKRLNEAVRRNRDRFPKDFMFQLTIQEFEFLTEFAGDASIYANRLRSQFATSKMNRGGRQYVPYVFTEQGVAMLSGVLKSEKAIQVNIYIMRAFVAMRRFIYHNKTLFARLDVIEKKQLMHELKSDKNFKILFESLGNQELKKQQIFFDSRIFDAYKFVNDLLKKAKKSIILIDNYIDESVLTLFSEIKNIKITIYTENLTEKLKLDLDKYNQQYYPIEIKKLTKCHDRFLIIDNTEVYHFGASIKDLGKKWFAFSKMNKESLEIIKKL